MSLRLEVAWGLGKSTSRRLRWQESTFFFHFDVFDFSRNSSRLINFENAFLRGIQIEPINSKTCQRKAEKAPSTNGLVN
jgi:hypothetical protein